MFLPFSREDWEIRTGVGRGLLIKVSQPLVMQSQDYNSAFSLSEPILFLFTVYQLEHLAPRGDNTDPLNLKGFLCVGMWSHRMGSESWSSGILAVCSLCALYSSQNLSIIFETHDDLFFLSLISSTIINSLTHSRTS